MEKNPQAQEFISSGILVEEGGKSSTKNRIIWKPV